MRFVDYYKSTMRLWALRQVMQMIFTHFIEIENSVLIHDALQLELDQSKLLGRLTDQCPWTLWATIQSALLLVLPRSRVDHLDLRVQTNCSRHLGFSALLQTRFLQLWFSRVEKPQLHSTLSRVPQLYPPPILQFPWVSQGHPSWNPGPHLLVQPIIIIKTQNKDQ